MDIDGWFHGICCTLPAGRAKFFFSLVLRKGGKEDRDNGLLPGKTGSHKESKIKSTLHHWLTESYLSALSGTYSSAPHYNNIQTNPLSDYCALPFSVTIQQAVSLSI